MSEYDDNYPTERRTSFSCTMCGSWDWPNPASSCPLCRGDEDEDGVSEGSDDECQGDAQPCIYCNGKQQYMDHEGMNRLCECQEEFEAGKELDEKCSFTRDCECGCGWSWGYDDEEEPTVSVDAYHELQRELEKTRGLYETACETAAKMHAAAVGEIKGPHIDPVQDVADVRRERDELEAERDTALSDLEFRRGLFQLQEQQLNDVRAERDRLAEVLNDLWHHYSLTGAAYELIEKALAAVEGGEA